eukprot:3267377-Amphidinium_carterae.1
MSLKTIPIFRTLQASCNTKPVITVIHLQISKSLYTKYQQLCKSDVTTIESLIVVFVWMASCVRRYMCKLLHAFSALLVEVCGESILVLLVAQSGLMIKREVHQRGPLNTLITRVLPNIHTIS